jgi:hypothetical protein
VYTPASGPPRCLTTATALDPDLLTQEETLTTIQPQQPAKRRLSLAPPAAELPDTRAAVARALLDQYVPILPVLDDQADGILGCFERANPAKLDELHSDPRFIIGRLFQALTALLQSEVPPMDATAQLLDEAIRDAIAYRLDRLSACPCGAECDRCAPEGRKALAYEGLWDRLGIIGELPKGRPELTAVDR